LSWPVAETPDEVPAVRIESPLATTSESPKPASGVVKRNEALHGSFREPVYEAYNCSVPRVCTCRFAPKIGGDDKKVNISKRRRISSMCKKKRIYGLTCVSD
jgi:hypothetical protein